MNNNGNGSNLNHSSNQAGFHQVSALEREKVKDERLKDETPFPLPFTPSPSSFDSPVILQQSSVWSQAILWGLMTVTTAAVVWACVAKIEEAVPAAGKLEPVGTVKEVQAPLNGVVKAIYVEDGQRVNKGDRLLELDPLLANPS